jgi:hypothetical protein
MGVSRDVGREGLRCDRNHASVATMNAREAMRATSLGKLGEAVGEVANGGAGRNGDQAECGDGNPCACVEAVQQEHESGDHYGRNRK